MTPREGATPAFKLACAAIRGEPVDVPSDIDEAEAVGRYCEYLSGDPWCPAECRARLRALREQTWAVISLAWAPRRIVTGVTEYVLAGKESEGR
jgi:hypothetical protein